MANDHFKSRISSGFATVQGWEKDQSLLDEVRASIPLDELMPDRAGSARQEEKSPYANDDDSEYEEDDLLLKRLALYFQRDVMTWVNQPPCVQCGNADTQSAGTRGPESADEREGGAARVEMYSCPSCGDETTTFPRYNSPRAVFQARRGRCGEYANLFGTYCRALGYDTRYVLDFTDHVWVEVWSDRRGAWLHADACEGKIDEPSMYEHGWGKKLSYVLAFTSEGRGHVVDVTGRYSRKLLSGDMQTRRREHCVSEEGGHAILRQANMERLAQDVLSKARLEELDRKEREEIKFFHLAQQSGTWEEGAYREGRTSGSLVWRAARDELGNESGADSVSVDMKEGGKHQQELGSFHVESFMPPLARNGDKLELSISVAVPSATSNASGRDAVVVSGVECAVGSSGIISIVIVEEHSGCILQSKSFPDWSTAASFLHVVPDGRIAAIYADVLDDSLDTDDVQELLSRLGSLDLHNRPKEGKLLYFGQVGYNPGWASCKVTASDVGISLRLQLPTSGAALKVRVEADTAPQSIVGRLSEDIMPIGTQLLATELQKRAAFNQLIESQRDVGGSANVECNGYVTKAGAPIYLISASAFPLQRCGDPSAPSSSKVTETWSTHHLLPEQLVPERDELIEPSELPAFDVPVDAGFFCELLGGTLLAKDGSGTTSIAMDTAQALHNTRLVALYFSAHWCGPCRGFTPMLCEFYEHLKEEVLPSHGLEVVFVSGDRDRASFDQYHGTMPWLALPFERQQVGQSLSARYGVRGIPSLVVLDSITGQVVVATDQARTDVGRACRGGEDSIASLVTEGWLSRVPPESTSLMESLALSCQDGAGAGDGDGAAPSFLRRDLPPPAAPYDAGARIKEIFAELVGGGEAPNAAAARAIQMAAEEQQQRRRRRPPHPAAGAAAELPRGPLHDLPWRCSGRDGDPPPPPPPPLLLPGRRAGSAGHLHRGKVPGERGRFSVQSPLPALPDGEPGVGPDRCRSGRSRAAGAGRLPAALGPVRPVRLHPPGGRPGSDAAGPGRYAGGGGKGGGGRGGTLVEQGERESKREKDRTNLIGHWFLCFLKFHAALFPPPSGLVSFRLSVWPPGPRSAKQRCRIDLRTV